MAPETVAERLEGHHDFMKLYASRAPQQSYRFDVAT